MPARCAASGPAPWSPCSSWPRARRASPHPRPRPPRRPASPTAATDRRAASRVREPPTPSPPRRRPRAPRVVVLDPGHNGGNAGAPAAINRQVPDGRGGTKACNTTGTVDRRRVSRARLHLRRRAARGAAADRARRPRRADPRQTTRVSGPCVDVRGRAGEQAGADAVVSIHADGAAPAGHGFHVAYSDPPLNAAQRGPARTLAADLRDGLVQPPASRRRPTSAATGSPRASTSPGSTSPPARRRWSSARTCATPQEAAVVSSPAGRDRYAAAIADGILRFLGG